MRTVESRGKLAHDVWGNDHFLGCSCSTQQIKLESNSLESTFLNQKWNNLIVLHEKKSYLASSKHLLRLNSCELIKEPCIRHNKAIIVFMYVSFMAFSGVQWRSCGSECESVQTNPPNNAEQHLTQSSLTYIVTSSSSHHYHRHDHRLDIHSYIWCGGDLILFAFATSHPPAQSTPADSHRHP